MLCQTQATTPPTFDFQMYFTPASSEVFILFHQWRVTSTQGKEEEFGQNELWDSVYQPLVYLSAATFVHVQISGSCISLKTSLFT